MKPLARSLPAVAFVEVLESRTAPATLTWDGSTSNLWNVAANWAENAVPQDGDLLVFPDAGVANKSNTNDIAGLELLGIQLNGSDYVIGGQALTISSAVLGGTPTTSGAGPRLTMALTFSADGFIGNNGLHRIEIDGAVDLGGHTLTINGTGGEIRIDGGITGSGAVVKAGTTTALIRNVTSTFTGATTISSGTIILQNNGGLGASGSANGTSVASGATLDLSTTTSVAESISIAGTGIGGAGALRSNSAGTHTLTGQLTLVGDAEADAGSGSTIALAGGLSVDINGAADFETLTFEGAGALTLGGTLSLGGTFQPATSASFTIVSAAGGLSGTFAGLPDGATIRDGTRFFTVDYTATAVNLIALPVSIWDGGSSGGGANSNWTTAANWEGNVAPAAGSILIFPEGALRLTNTNNFALDTSFRQIVIEGGDYLIDGTRITLTNGLSGDASSIGATAPQFNVPLKLGAAQTFENRTAGPSGLNLTVRLGGDIDLNGFALTLDGNVGMTLSGDIGSGGGLVKNGTNTVTLSGADSIYAGTTAINSGVVIATTINALGDSGAANATVVAAGAALRLQNAGTLAESITISGTGVGGTGALVNLAGNNTLNATLTLAGTATLGITNAGNTFTLDGNLAVNVDGETPGTNLETLTLTGAGTLNLSGGLSMTGNFIPAQSQELIILDNSGTGAVTGTFTGFPDEFVFGNNGRNFRIDYQGGTGNDVTLIGQLPTFTWNGGATDPNWMNADNWSTDQLPFPGSRLLFPSGAGQLTNTNNLLSGTVFESIAINALGYQITGNAVVLGSSITTNFSTGAGSSLNVPLTLAADAAFVSGSTGILTLDEQINLNGHTLTFAGPGGFRPEGAIVGAGAIVKNETGTLLISGANTYTGQTTINAGTVIAASGTAFGATGPGNGTIVANGAILSLNPINLAEEITISGTGTAGSGALVVPMGSASLTGALTLVGNASIRPSIAVTFSIEGPLRLDIDGVTPGTGFETLSAISEGTSTFTLAGPLELGGTFQPLVGTAFKIVDRSGAGTHNGAFDGLAEGATITHNGREFTISYAGGDGNDVVLTTTGSIDTFTWDGGGADANWTTAANWVGDNAPLPGGVLLFPAAAAQLTNTNNFAAGTGFHSIRITGGDYVIGGNRVALTAGIVSSQTSGAASQLNTPLTLSDEQTFSNDGSVRIELGGSINLNGHPLTIDGADDLDLLGAISGVGGLTKNGGGTLTLTAENNYTGRTLLNEGIVVLSSEGGLGAGGPGNDTVVADGASVLFLGATRFPEDFSISGDGTGLGELISFTTNRILTGALTLDGNATIGNAAGSTTLEGPLRLDINGITAGSGFEQLTTGVLSLAGELQVGGTFLPVIGTQFKIINNITGLAGTFTDLPEGATFDSNGRQFRISYVGGDGNDVVLTTLASIDDLVISPDGKTATFGDVDGDRVTVKSSIGAFAQDGSNFTLAPRVDFQSQLQALTLDASFKGASITITAKPSDAGGNGFVNLGFLNAAGVDLGAVTIAGDLARLAAGTVGGDPKVPALKSLTVQSLGHLGRSTLAPVDQGFLGIQIEGALPKLTVAGDVRDSIVEINGGDEAKLGAAIIGGSLLCTDGSVAAIIVQSGIGSLTIGGDVRTASVSGSSVNIYTSGPLGTLKIGGGVYGDGGDHINFGATGQLQPPASGLDFALKTLSVRGSVEGLNIILGGGVNADAALGTLFVGGDWIASKVAAGVDSGPDLQLGTADDVKLSGGADVAGRFSTIQSITIKGQAIGNPRSSLDMFGIVAERIGKAKVGERTFAFIADTPTTQNREAFFAAPTIDGEGQEIPLFDFTIREIGSTTPTNTIAAGVDFQLGDGKTVTFNDVDGDRVTVKRSAGTFVVGDFDIVQRAFGGGQLRTLTINAPVSVSITATPGPDGGNGFVNVGFIDAGSNDLGDVLVDGDLGRLRAGNGDDAQPAVKSLTAHSLGALGASTQAGGGSVVVNLDGSLGALTVGGDVRFSTFITPDSIGSVTIGGAFFGEFMFGGSLIADGGIGSVKVGGSVLGASLSAGFGAIGAVSVGGDLSAAGSGFAGIFANGQATPPASGLDLALKSLSVKGTVDGVRIEVGTNPFDANADASIGKISVGRGWLASSLTAGTAPGPDNLIGTADDTKPIGTTSTRDVANRFATIASIVIKGQAFGSVATGDSFGFVAEQIGKAKIGTRSFKFDPGPRDAFDSFAIAPTHPGAFVTGLPFDFFLREIAV